MNSFYSREKLKSIGFKSFGENVLISRFARFYSPGDITMGDNVRIDDFCILSGDINLKNYIHLSAFCALYGRNGIEINSFSGLSPRCTIFSANDDFSGEYLIGPMVPEKFTNVTGGKVILKQYTQLGAGTIVMPNVIIEEGVAVGAMSFVKESLEPWSIYAGNPLKHIKSRSKKLLKKYNQVKNHG